MTTATNETRSEIANQIANLLTNNQSGSIVSDIGTFVAINVEQMKIHTIVTVDGKQMMNANLGRIVDTTLLALGYRLTH